MKLIVCLGNPGKDYTKNRHNAGFLFADYLVDKYNFTDKGKKFKGRLFEGAINNEQVLLIKPETFMNLSGESVQLVACFYKISSQNIWVVFDDFDIPFSTIRYREKGGAGTHNGMKSVIGCLKTQEFPRLRIGVGPLPEHWDVSNFVLSNFTEEQVSALPNIFKDVEETFLKQIS